MLKSFQCSMKVGQRAVKCDVVLGRKAVQAEWVISWLKLMMMLVVCVMTTMDSS